MFIEIGAVAVPWKTKTFSCFYILVPTNRAPFAQHQESRPLGGSIPRSPRFTDFPSKLANRIGWEYETNTLCKLWKSSQARALDPCRRPEGSWALGTRMVFLWSFIAWATLALSAIKVHHEIFFVSLSGFCCHIWITWRDNVYRWRHYQLLFFTTKFSPILIGLNCSLDAMCSSTEKHYQSS